MILTVYLVWYSKNIYITPVTMKVTKRNGEKEDVSFDKILFRIKNLSKDIGGLGELTKIDPGALCKEVISSVYDGITSEEIDELTARIAINWNTDNSEYGDLASRIAISNMHKKTTDKFSEAMETLYANIVHDEATPVVSEQLIKIVRENKDYLESIIDYERDYMFDYFGFKTLERSYLLKVNKSEGEVGTGVTNTKIVVERPQHLWLRVSIGIHPDNIERVAETYHLMSQGYFTHATPTLFNSGTPHQQLSSCVHEDTMIFTVNKGSIKIKEVQIGDQVITHLGNVKPVTQLHSNPINDRNFYELQVHNSKVLRITGNHPVWAIDDEHRVARWIPVQDLNATHYISLPRHGHLRSEECLSVDLVDFIAEFDETASFECIKIEEPRNVEDETEEQTIQVTEMIVFNKSIVRDRDLSASTIKEPSESVQRLLWFTPIISEFLGIFYRYGRVLPGYLLVLDEIYNNELKEFCCQVIENYFTEDYTVQFSRIVINSKFLGFVFTKLFGGRRMYHHLPNDFHKGWEYSHFKGFLDGFFDFDSEVVVYSETLADQIYQLGRSFGYDINYTDSNSGSFLLSLSENSCDSTKVNTNKILTTNGGVFMKVMSKVKINAPEFVYNIGVADDHSYSAEGLVIKNCFLLYVEDSMKGIYKCLSDTAIISKHAGGIGICATDIRGNGSYIRGTNGTSEGIIKMLRVFNDTGRYANQGGKRSGSIAIYLEPHAPDIFEFLDIRKNSGDENLRCRDLFYGLWIPDLFMKTVEEDGDWYLMTSNVSKGLSDVYGEEYEELYNKYVEQGKYVKKIKARELFNKIINTQIETGMPYMLYKDSVNRKSNQKNFGVVKSSNLCAEIVIVSNKDEYGTCNISTIGLGKYVETNTWGRNPKFNFKKLYEVAKTITINMNNVIDNNFYPVPETRLSNMSSRPVAIGVQGYSNMLFKLRLPFESKEAKELNKKVFETIQYACLEASCELAKEFGPYPRYEGSPASKGLFQHNLWGISVEEEKEHLSGLWNWDSLRKKVLKYGLRNSLLTALPPTASTSQILGNYESFEPITSNFFLRSTSSGTFPVVNKYLVKDLEKLGLWDEDMKDYIIANKGSIQAIEGIPDDIKELYKIVWEIPQKTLLELAADRSKFICQTSSQNCYMESPSIGKITSMHFHAWKLGLKTGMYYMRSRTKVTAEQFTVSSKIRNEKKNMKQEATPLVCNIDNKECSACSG